MQSKHSTSFALPLFTSAVLLTGTMTIWGQEEQGTPNNQAVLQPFLSEHCISCHGEKKQKPNSVSTSWISASPIKTKPSNTRTSSMSSTAAKCHRRLCQSQRTSPCHESAGLIHLLHLGLRSKDTSHYGLFLFCPLRTPPHAAFPGPVPRPHLW